MSDLQHIGQEQRLHRLNVGRMFVFLVGAQIYMLLTRKVHITFFFFCLFAFARAASTVYGGSQARGPIRAAAASLCQSHSNVGSESPL